MSSEGRQEDIHLYQAQHPKTQGHDNITGIMVLTAPPHTHTLL